MNPFREIGVSDALVNVLEAQGIERPFAIQELALPAALKGEDVLAKAPTGSGKTLAFGIPLVERLSGQARPEALVLVPTRELCAQVAEALKPLAAARGLKIAAVYGGVPFPQQIKEAKEAELLVATPGRLQDLVERRAVSLDGVSMLVLDEADRMLDMGFKPQVDRLVRRLPRERQTMFFSATLDGEVGELARAYTVHPARFAVERPAEEKGEIEHRFVSVSEATKLETLVRLIEEAHDLTLVFVRTKRGADRVASRLKEKGLAASALHGDMSQRDRERTLERFEGGKVAALVATDVAARGLDLERITHVINYDPPDESTSYTHRVGRTGRAGRQGVALTLVLPEQEEEVSRVASVAGQKEEFASTGMKVGRPRLVYSGTRRGRWGSPSQRRKI